MSDHRVVVQLPFPGFYESWLSSELDNCEERDCEGLADKQEEDGIPVELRLDAGDFGELMWRVADYGKMHQFIAEKWVEVFSNFWCEEGEEIIPMEFEKMMSPKEYNFTTDRVFAYIPFSYMEDMLAKVDKTVLEKFIKDKFTSRSGFSSFYSNDLEDWLEKPLEEWDHNEFGTLLEARFSEFCPDDDKWFYYYLEHIPFYEAFDKGVDWAKLEELVEEKRDELRQALEAEGEEPTPAPCKHTKDLFKGDDT